jgi:hypothetical protein
VTPLGEETYDFRSNDEDDCQDAFSTRNLSVKMTVEQEVFAHDGSKSSGILPRNHQTKNLPTLNLSFLDCYMT